jgi:hypothetical protein
MFDAPGDEGDKAISDPLAGLRDILDPLCANSGRPSPAQVGLAEDDDRRRRGRGECELDAAQGSPPGRGRWAMGDGLPRRPRMGATIKSPGRGGAGLVGRIN